MALWAVGIVALTLLVRLPTFRFPLDQDGSVFCYCAQTWAEGGLPYRDAWDHKLPLIYLVFRALFAVAPPESVPVNTTLRVGSALCDAATALLLMFLARRLFGTARGIYEGACQTPLVTGTPRRVFGTAVGVAAGVIYALFTGAAGLQGEAFQPERLAALFTVAGVAAAAAYVESYKYRYAAACGLLFGVALAAKQIAAPVGVVVWAWLTWWALGAQGRLGVRRVLVHSVLLAVGAVLPWALCAGYFAARGAFADFWECTYTFNVIYAEEHRKGTLLDGVRQLFAKQFYDHVFLWLTAAGGIALALVRGRRSPFAVMAADGTFRTLDMARDRDWLEGRRSPLEVRADGSFEVLDMVRQRDWEGGLLVGGWTLATFLALVLPGQFAFYYYIPTVAPLAVGSAVGLVGLWALVRRPGPALLRLGAVGCSVVLLAMLALAAKRSYGAWREATDPGQTNAVVAQVARNLASKTKPTDRLYMRGGRMQVYILSGRRSASPYLYDFHYNVPPDRAYHYRPEILKAILESLERYRPPYIVVTKGGTRGSKVTKGAYDDLDARFPAFKQYLAAKYELERDWPAWPYSLMVFRRKDAP